MPYHNARNVQNFVEYQFSNVGSAQETPNHMLQDRQTLPSWTFLYRVLLKFRIRRTN